MTKILIVDDNEMQHELFRCFAMSNDSIEIEHAISLTEAMVQIEKTRFDIVMLDNRLHPYENFTQTAPTIRQVGFGGYLAVISADICNPVFNRIEDFGVQRAIDKSDFSIAGFTNLVAELTFDGQQSARLLTG